MRRINALHDRLGVTFTALVEITVSTITSLSVCALVGFQVTLVPWYVLLCRLGKLISFTCQQGIVTNCYHIRRC